MFSDKKRSGIVPASVWAVLATFGAYFCMYMFRKPFTSAKFEDVSLWGLGFKSVLVLSQVIGYTISKFIGVKMISEIQPEKRARVFVGLILSAEVTLIGFGLTPAPWNVIWLFLNGLPLGMVFGLVLGFLEGRRKTEALAAGLCVSFIFADGIAKSVGTWLTTSGVSEFWMPAAAGAIFLAPILFFAWMLTRIPAPDERDVLERSERAPMTKLERGDFFRKFAPGLLLLLVMYSLIGILRGVRGDFAPEIWAGLHEKADASMFARSEILAGSGVLLVFALVALIRDNRRGLVAGLTLATVGCAVLMISLVGIGAKSISPFIFMALTGFGLYLPYFAVHTTVFERLIALTRERGNIGYLMYLADASSYAGYVVVLLIRTLTKPNADSFFSFFFELCWVVAITGLVTLIPAGLLLNRNQNEV